jgi:hypothetical protein
VTVASRPSGLASPRLQRLARGRPDPTALPSPAEACDLCGTEIPGEHRHLVDLQSRELLCACRACSLLFDRQAAGGGHFRLVPDRRLRLEAFRLTDLTWEQLRIPVEMAFFFASTPAERVLAFYPGPMGATESLLELETWRDVVRANPILATMEPDVEALLVNRARGARRQWLVPIDDCYRLVALIRVRWRGFTGGKEVWTEIDRFFENLDGRARVPARTVDQPVPERR